MPAKRILFTQWPSAEKRPAIARLCELIRAAAPEAEELGGMPRRFLLHGIPLVSVGVSATHCSFYVMSQRAMAAFSEELDELNMRYSKGTISFKPDNPIPPDLVARIVKHRAAENLAMHSIAQDPDQSQANSQSKT